MSTLTIRRLDDDVKQRLRLRAAHDGISMEEAARRILARELAEPNRYDTIPLAPKGTRVPGNIVDRIAAIVAPIGGANFSVPPRLADWEPPVFVDDEKQHP
jgi:plasmid stability protein